MPVAVQTLLKLLPIALFGAWLPTWTSHIVLLLGTNRPVRSPLAFITGNATYRFLLGLGVLFLFTTSAVQSFVDGIPSPGPVFYVLIGLVAIVAGLGVRASGKREDNDSGKPGWLDKLVGLPLTLILAWGFLTVASPGIQYVYFLAGMNVITTAQLTWEMQIILLAVFVALLQTMLLIPVGIYVWKRDEADSIIAKVMGWLERYGTPIFTWMLLGIGVLLIGYAALAYFAGK